MALDESKIPSFWLLVAITGTAIFSVQLVVFMLGPLLVAMATDLNVEVAMAGQLNTVLAIVWLFTAFVAG